jgi:hypothetical protein
VRTADAAPADGGARERGVPTHVDELAEETALLGAAQSALARGDAASALALLDEHATRFPRGELAPERRAARALALCKSGRVEEGRREGEALYGKSRESPLAEKIDRACAR